MYNRVIMADVNGVAQAEDGISHSLQVGFAISEISGRFLEPFTEPFSALGGLSVSVRGHHEDTDHLAGTLEEEG